MKAGFACVREERADVGGNRLQGPEGLEEKRLHRQGRVREALREERREAGQVLGQAGQADRLDQALHARQEHVLRLSRRLDQMVRGRHAQRLGQLHRPPPEEARRPGRHHLGARRSRRAPAPHHLSRAPPRGEHLRQRAQVDGRQARRPRHHLSADDPRGGLRHARLRAHRRHPFGGVRRLLAGLALPAASPTASRSLSSPPTRACAAARRSRSSTIPTRR